MRVQITKQAERKIRNIVRINKQANNDNEIGAWLIGRNTINDGEIISTIEDVHIPRQTVTGTEVEIDEKSMIETYKELGLEKTNNIIGHWHIHPFAKDDTNWSSTDEEKIRKMMEPEKGRNIFTFLLNSQTKTKGRIEVRTNASILGLNLPVTMSQDGIEPEYEYEEEDLEEQNRLINEVKAKVTQKREEEWQTTFKTESSKGKNKEKRFNMPGRLTTILNEKNYQIMASKKLMIYIIKKSMYESMRENGVLLDIEDFGDDIQVEEKGKYVEIMIRKEDQVLTTQLENLLYEFDGYNEEIEDAHESTIPYSMRTYDDYL